MAKEIKYKVLLCEVNHGTEEEPIIEQIIVDTGIECETQADFDTNYSIAEKEAIPGTINVSGEFDPEQDTASTDDVLNALLGVTV
jgi:hypothetical protein